MGRRRDGRINRQLDGWEGWEGQRDGWREAWTHGRWAGGQADTWWMVCQVTHTHTHTRNLNPYIRKTHFSVVARLIPGGCTLKLNSLRNSTLWLIPFCLQGAFFCLSAAYGVRNPAGRYSGTEPENRSCIKLSKTSVVEHYFPDPNAWIIMHQSLSTFVSLNSNSRILYYPNPRPKRTIQLPTSMNFVHSRPGVKIQTEGTIANTTSCPAEALTASETEAYVGR